MNRVFRILLSIGHVIINDNRSRRFMPGIVSRILEEYPNFTPSSVYSKLIEMTNNQAEFNKFKGYGTPTFSES